MQKRDNQGLFHDPHAAVLVVPDVLTLCKFDNLIRRNAVPELRNVPEIASLHLLVEGFDSPAHAFQTRPPSSKE